MKIAVINFSGNVGKSTVTRHLLAPRMPTAEVITIESINSDDMVDPHRKNMRGEEFGKLYARLLWSDEAIVDIGTSNVEEFDAGMSQYDGSHEVFDRYIVPTLMDSKQQKDTRATIEALSEKGVPPESIRLLFNKVEINVPLADGFSQLFDLYRADPCFVLDERAVLFKSDIYSAASKAGRTVGELAANREIYKTHLAAATDADDRDRLSHLLADAAMAVGVNRQLDSAFYALMR